VRCGCVLVAAAGYVPVVIGGLGRSAPLDPGGILFPNMFLPADMRRLVARMPLLPPDRHE